MGIMDKIQSGVERVTQDDTRLTTAEITTIQQAYNAMQLGLVKSRFYAQQTRNPQVKQALENLVDEFLEPHMERPRRILEKAGIAAWNLNPQERVANLPPNVPTVLRDEEILLDTVLAMQATVMGLQAGALGAVRGEVRDWFLQARDAAFESWRRVGMVVVQVAPQMLPPTMSGVTTS